MIKFFRKIRQNLLNQGKTKKYLAYALGEIVLVVIGILLALQINNWNETKKVKSNEKELLLYVLQNLKEDSLIIDRFLKSSETILNVHRQLVAYVNHEIPQDSVGNLDLIRRSIPWQLITRKNNPELSNFVLDHGVKKQVLAYYLSVGRTEFIIEETNKIIEDVVRPYLGERGLLNFGSHLEDFNKEYIDLIHRDLFFKALEDKAMQQILFESGLKVNAISNLKYYVAIENEKLKTIIKQYLSFH